MLRAPKQRADGVSRSQGATAGRLDAESAGTDAAQRRGLVSLVVPTRNEAGNIDKLVAEIERLPAGLVDEVIFVDDSSDETPQVVEDARARSSLRIVLIHRPPERRSNGLGGAVVEGLRTARAPWACVMDADLQHPPALIADLFTRAHKGDVDLVVASRYTHDRVVRTGLEPFRRAVSKLLTAAARMLFPGRLRAVADPMSGFFLVRRESVDLDRLRPRGFKILLEILVRTPNLARAEIPFRFGERFAGDSKASLREGLVYIGQLVRLRFGATAHDFTRFGLVGAIGLGVNMVLFAFFLRVVGLNYLAAAVVATQGSTLSNFILTERWVFARRDHRLGDRSRLALFFLMNNLTLLLRGPLLVLLVSGAGLNELLANFLSLVALTVVRYAVADTVIWSPASKGAAEKRRPVGYDIHGIVTVMSDVPLPELEAFRTDERLDRPTIRVRIGKLSAKQSELVAALAFFARHIRYDERLGRFGFGIEIGVGRSIEILASPLLKWSPHVLYTNVVEPVLRWTVVKKGYALVHGACVAADGTAHLITARTDTGKTTTILRALDRYPGLAFVSDDLTLVRADGTVLTYPKPLTVSQHTVRAVRTPLLSLRERLMLVYQSRIHSRSGRRFAFLLAGARLPTATINAIVQLLVPPPKYRIERLVPGVEVATESKLGGVVVIERGPDDDVRLDGDEALEILMANCDDAYGFPPYSTIAPFLHGSNGRDLRREERAIVAQALIDLPAVLLRSDRMAWAERLPAVVGHPAVEGDADDALPILSPA